MIRVGIIGTYVSPQWMGGVNYLRNLFCALTNYSEFGIQPVLFLPPQIDPELFAMIPKLIVKQPAALSPSFAKRVSKSLTSVALGHDPFLERLLKQNQIDVVTHSGSLGTHSAFPTVGWIADLQQVAMPEFFSSKECSVRNRSCIETLRDCNFTFLSSKAAQHDLAEFSPQYSGKVRVLNFVSGLVNSTQLLDFQTISKKYDIVKPYIYLPNQFWRHKNHSVVVEALRILAASHRHCTVLATGHTQDWRQPDHFDKIKQSIETMGLNDSFKILGLVPGDEVDCLMRNAAAILNPSHFEGWSTTVEEAKTLGKKVLLSDITVHREQNPERAEYFDPDDPQHLSELIYESIEEYSEGREMDFHRIAQMKIASRATEFARVYKDVIFEAIASK